ncbi:MAG TPA: hypothetical protein VM658_16120 [bacterium]|nr:hypothetical protein [bacterium]
MAETLATDHPARIRYLRLTLFGLFGLTLAGYLLLINADIFFTYWPDQTNYLACGVAWAEGFGPHYIADVSAPLDYIFHHSGFGAMLAPIIWARGLDIPLLKGLVIAVFFAGLACYGNLIARRGGNLIGWQAAILTATAPFVLAFSQLIMADLPFLGAALVALWAFDQWGRSRSWPWLLVCLAATFLANELRIVGLALVLSLILPLARHPRGGPWPAPQKYAALAVLVAIPLWWPIYGWFEQGIDFFRPFGSEIQKIDGIRHVQEWSPWLMLLERVRNLPANLASLGQAFIPEAGSGIGAGLIGLAALPLCGAGLVSYWKRFASAHEYFLVSYLLVLLAWPYAEHRYFLPLYPLIFVFAVEGMRGLADRFHLRLVHSAPALLFGAVLACNLTMVMAEVVNFRPVPAGQTRFKKLPSDSPPWLIEAPGLPSIPVTDRFRMLPINEPRRNLLLLELWCRTHLSKADRVAVSFENDFFLITGIRCGVPFRPGEPLSEYRSRTGINYVIIGEGIPRLSNNIIRWMKQEPERFVEVHRIAGTRTAIYRVR